MLKRKLLSVYSVIKRILLLIGNIVSFILLTFIYFTAAGATKLFGAICGKRFLPAAPKNSATFWHDRQLEKPALTNAKRQY